MTVATRSFPLDAASVPAARRFVRDTLAQHGAMSTWDVAAMLVSELATNAVLHARTPFSVHVLVSGDVLRVSVLDGSSAIPRQRTYGAESTTGRGIRLVATLAAAWGVEQQPAGKTVWFEVAADDPEKAVEHWERDVDVDALLAGFEDTSDDGDVRATASRGAALVRAVA